MNIRYLVVIWVCLGAVPPAAAGPVQSATVALADGRYHIHFAVIIAGDADRLSRVVTDYSHLDRLSPTVVASRLISGRNGHNARIEVTLRPCVLVIFCKTLTKVSDSRVSPGGMRVTYRIVPELSDFHEGREAITMTETSSDGASRVHFEYSAVLKPKFYVPPFVGPWLVRRQIIRDLETVSRRVERILQGEDVADEH